MKQQNKQAYTIIVVILIIGFLMVLTIGILKLVMDEMRDNVALGNYHKAYIGAESAQELALLRIKQEGVGYNSPLQPTKWFGNSKKDPTLSYINEGTIVNTFTGTIPKLGNVIMPLFTIDKNKQVHTSSDVRLDVKNSSDISWNILSTKGGIVGTGDFWKHRYGQQKSITTTTSQGQPRLSYMKRNIATFLEENESEATYLLLFNGGTNPITYKITTNDAPITKPLIDIISTAEVGDYKQNIKTTIDVTKMNARAKYSIYSK